MIRFETLLEKVRSYSPEADLELLRRAYVFSALEHKGQVRHSGEPYLVHPLEVADFLADMKLDVVAVAAGLLHDVVEDTLTTPERIAELFGPEIAHVVEGVTKIRALHVTSSGERLADTLPKMHLAQDRREHHRRAHRHDPRQTRRSAGPDHSARRPHQASLQHSPQAQAPEDRHRTRLRLRRHPRDHAVGQGLLRGARHHSPDMVAG